MTDRELNRINDALNKLTYSKVLDLLTIKIMHLSSENSKLRAELASEKEKHRSHKCEDEKPEYGQQVILNYGETYIHVQGYWNGERWVITGESYKEPYIQPISWQSITEGNL